MLAVPAFALAVLAAALLAGPSPIRRTLALAVVLAAAVLPWAAPAVWPAMRSSLSLCSVGLLLRVTELCAARDPVSAWARLWQCTSFFDTNLARPVPARFDGRLALAVLGYGALGALAVGAVLALGPHPAGYALRAARWLAGAAFVYAAVDAGAAFVTLAHRAAGIEPPRLHRAPVASRSVREFWGERWNHPVHHWLRRFVFAPLARRRMPNAGAAVSFAVSAVLHAYFVLPAARFAMAGAMLAFFALQGAFLLLEGRTRVRRWPPAAARAWTVCAVLLPSPLFVEPLLRALGV